MRALDLLCGTTLLLASFGLGACGGSSVEPDPTLDAFVGEWDAIRLVIQSQANPEIAPDLIELGGAFFLDVQPSGNYQANLSAFGQFTVEFGRIEVDADRITLHKENPPPPRSDVGTYRFSADTLFLTGTTDFDFDMDGQVDAANLLADLVKRP